MVYTLRVLNQNVSIDRVEAVKLLLHAKAAGGLDLFFRRRGRICFSLGRTRVLGHQVFVVVESNSKRRV